MWSAKNMVTMARVFVNKASIRRVSLARSEAGPKSLVYQEPHFCHKNVVKPHPFAFGTQFLTYMPRVLAGLRRPEGAIAVLIAITSHARKEWKAKVSLDAIAAATGIEHGAEEAEQQRALRLNRRAAGPRKASSCPFSYRELRLPALAIQHFLHGDPDWDETAAEILRVIVGFADLNDSGAGGRFKRNNRAGVEQMRQPDRGA